MTEKYYETSFRFKWGTGFLIEALSLVLSRHPEFLPVSYLLEGQSYSYDRTENEFVESDLADAQATATNLVLLVGEEKLKKMLSLADENGDALKEELIVEFSAVVEPDEAPLKAEDEEAQAIRVDHLRQTYDQMPLVAAILTYTQLKLNYGPGSALIDDPEPKEQNDEQNFIS